ncbi:hypothetical protein GOB93_12365 [Acetobacter musti]|uniref:Uncharacterized protein n=1 Tax=Acetobacter musti TaxID=864732 RepID=A0ABX0JRJ0_9PROT|nr:hypothetical protein [Acetobacter musti]NHN85429.1 hypothetical protein [Acetobacter musti]
MKQNPRPAGTRPAGIRPALFLAIAALATPYAAHAAPMSDMQMPDMQSSGMKMPASGFSGHGAHDCPTPGSGLTPELSSWRTPVPVTAATSEATLPTAIITPGKAARVHLAGTPDVHFPLRPAEPGGSVSSAGMVRFTVPATGTWRVMLGNRAWIDVTASGTALASTGHHHGPACSGIGKMVEFPLTAGTPYTLQLSGSGTPDLEVMIAPMIAPAN